MPTTVFLFTLLAMFQSAVDFPDQGMLKNYLENKAPFDFILIDVRGAEEISVAIGNATCKPYNLQWPEPFQGVALKIPKDLPVIVYCGSGVRAARAAAYLKEAGYTRVYNAGGILTWTGPTVPACEIKPASLLPEPSTKASRINGSCRSGS